MRAKALNAVRWTSAAAAVSSLLHLVQVAVLARLLDPEDYGLMAMVAVITSFAVLFVDFGLNSAYLQRLHVSPEQRSSLFWVNVGMSAVLALLVSFSSTFLANYFEDDRIAPLIQLSALTFIISALGQQLRITAQKNLEFSAVVKLETASAIVGFVAAVVLALLGLGVYSLVLGTIVTSLTGTILGWIFISNGWRPLWRLKYADIKPFLGFGGAMVGNAIVNQINMTIDLFLGGRMLAATQLGVYSVPRNIILQLQLMVNPIITRVGFPLIAKVQHDTRRVRTIYLKTINMTASVNAPVYIGLAFFSSEIVEIFLGLKWSESHDVFSILAIWGLFRSAGNPVGSLLFGMGRANLALKWNIMLVLITAPVLWYGSGYGIYGLAWSLLGLQVALFVPGWYVLVRPICEADFIEYASAMLKPVLFSVLAVFPSYFFSLSIDGPLLKLSLALIGSVPLYLVISYLGNRSWFDSVLELIGCRVTPSGR